MHAKCGCMLAQIAGELKSEFWLNLFSHSVYLGSPAKATKRAYIVLLKRDGGFCVDKAAPVCVLSKDWVDLGHVCDL